MRAFAYTILWMIFVGANIAFFQFDYELSQTLSLLFIGGMLTVIAFKIKDSEE